MAPNILSNRECIKCHFFVDKIKKVVSTLGRKLICAGLYISYDHGLVEYDAL